MEQFPDIAEWRAVFVEAVTELGTKIAGFLPSLLGAVLILIIGWLLSRSLGAATGRALRTFGLDRAATRMKISDVLERAGVTMTLSEIVARLVFWLLMLTFVLSGVETLGLTAVTSTIDRLIAFIPNLIGAALIVLLGLLLARFAGKVASSAAAAAGFPTAPRLGVAIQIAVSGLVFVVAIEQLGIGTNVLIAPLTAVLAAAALSAGLAFALGARPIVTHILAGHFLRQSLPRDCYVEIEGERGMVERIGPTETVLRNEEKSWSIPNARLLDLVVIR
ncbi:MAG: hypothetical protein JRE43_06505 [Deltaproteobacteria bacterium]|nr:hypothetical protein [Deltaproteobacteria bacterium]MBW2543051.1 hypothetical protein [Deltaproteobacteria bacterium]